MLAGKDKYLNRYGTTFEATLPDPVAQCSLSLVIPVLDEPDILECLKSLSLCMIPEGPCEILLIFNQSERATGALKERNRASYQQCVEWVGTIYDGPLYFIPVWTGDLPAKKAGVGLARKIGMDLALRRLEEDAVIVCLDADCLVDKNYLICIEDHFRKNSWTNAASIYFEHPLSGGLSPDNYDGIARYELYLRYFIQAQRYAGFPWAFHTIGSAMAVRSSAYIEQGGMNTRQAGEDFYFLHRLIPQGKFSEINDTRVLPSPRVSHRVPFGTGKAINSWLENEEIASYSLSTFEILKEFFKDHKYLFHGEMLETQGFLREFLQEQDFEAALVEIRSKSTSATVFRRHFFQWFNAFRVMKFANFYRGQESCSSDLIENSAALLQRCNVPTAGDSTTQLLDAYRLWDRRGPNKT